MTSKQKSASRVTEVETYPRMIVNKLND